MTKSVLFRVGVMLACVAFASWVFTVLATTEVWTRMTFTDEQLQGLDTVIWNVTFPTSIVLAGALWKLWLFPPGYRPPPRVETGTAADVVMPTVP